MDVIFTDTEELINLFRLKETYVKLKDYISETQMEKPINDFIKRINRKITKIARQLL